MKIKELEYNDFLELLTFIEGHFKDDEEHKIKTLLVLRKFFPKLEGIQLILLVNLIEGKTEELFNAFLSVAGENDFDPTGKSTPEDANFGGMNLDMLDMMTMNKLKDDAKPAVKRKYREMMAAKTLEPLILKKDLKSETYVYRKKVYLRKSEKAFSLEELNKFEENLKKLDVNYHQILVRMIDYISERSTDNGRLFFEHVSTRVLSCVMDSTLSDPRNVEYLEKLRKIS